MQKQKVADWNELGDRQPAYALVANVDLVVIRYDDDVSVLYGRCLHRGALLADGHRPGGRPDLRSPPAGTTAWTTGVSAYNNQRGAPANSTAWVDVHADAVYRRRGPGRPPGRSSTPSPGFGIGYLGALSRPTSTVPRRSRTTGYIDELARNGLSKNLGHHGKVIGHGRAAHRQLPTLGRHARC